MLIETDDHVGHPKDAKSDYRNQFYNYHRSAHRGRAPKKEINQKEASDYGGFGGFGAFDDGGGGGGGSGDFGNGDFGGFGAFEGFSKKGDD